jgi:hypothetical protein
MTYVSTAEEGIVWAIDDDHDVWVLREGEISKEEPIDNTPTWTPIPDIKFSYIDVGKQGQLVALKNTGCSFYMKGITKDLPQGSNEWFDLTNDQTVELSYFMFDTISICQTGSMWATLKGGDDALYFRGGVNNKFPAGSEWFRSNIGAPENLVQASCGFRGYVWAVGASGTLYRLDGVTADRPEGLAWKNTEKTGFTHVSVGDKGHVWATKADGTVVQVASTTAETWEAVSDSQLLVQVNVGDERVVGVNNWGEIFSRVLSEQNPLGDAWTQIPGQLKQVVTS